MIRPGDWLRTGLLALALLAFAPVRSALHADNEDVAETLARAAAFYASTDKTDLCEDLLELSIVLDPKGKEAIILKSKLKRELKVDAPEGFKVEDFVRELQDEIDSADNGYVTAALALAALAIDPENRVARVELFRLRNRELEGDLDRIVETLGNGGFFKIDKAPKPESRTLSAMLSSRARELAFARPDDERARKLLIGALAFNAGNEDALDLQAALVLGSKIQDAKDAPTADEVVKKLESHGKKSKKREPNTASLCWRMIEQLDPDNETMLLELGLEEETDPKTFDFVIRKVSGGATINVTPMATAKKEPGPDVTDDDGFQDLFDPEAERYSKFADLDDGRAKITFRDRALTYVIPKDSLSSTRTNSIGSKNYNLKMTVERKQVFDKGAWEVTFGFGYDRDGRVTHYAGFYGNKLVIIAVKPNQDRAIVKSVAVKDDLFKDAVTFEAEVRGPVIKVFLNGKETLEYKEIGRFTHGTWSMRNAYVHSRITGLKIKVLKD